MTERMLEENFEQIEAPFDRSLFSNLTHTSIELGRIAMEFARIERMPRYADGKRESDVEHSFMLALSAPELARSSNSICNLAFCHNSR